MLSNSIQSNVVLRVVRYAIFFSILSNKFYDVARFLFNSNDYLIKSNDDTLFYISSLNSDSLSNDKTSIIAKSVCICKVACVQL